METVANENHPKFTRAPMTTTETTQKRTAPKSNSDASCKKENKGF